MKIFKFMTGVLGTLLLASPLVVAESKYPAADFQPKVVYQDDSSKGSSSSSTGSSSARVKKQIDPKYPAANFEPSVVYNDDSYTHTKSAGGSVNSGSTQTSDAADDSSSESGGGSQNFVIGLILVSIVGFLFYKKTASDKPAAKRTVRRSKPAVSSGVASASGKTGVSRYLDKMPRATGVSRYLESIDRAPSTGVSKYLAKQVVNARQVAATKVTGVEKYLRDRS